MSIVYSGDKITFADSSVQSSAGTGFRNRIINGDMRIDQRNAGASMTQTAALTYSLDRWRLFGSATSKFTIQQNAGSVTPPNGFTNYLGVTSSSAYTVGAGETYRVEQPIEGYNLADLAWGTANAKAVTVSFWVRSSLTGTFGGGLWNADATRAYPFSYTISSANTWEQKTINIAGDTTGTWNKTNGSGLVLQFSMGAGSTHLGTAGSWGGTLYTGVTGQTQVVGTSGATFYITGVQLELGSSASSFEVRDYGRELRMCYRYYQKIGNTSYGAIGSGIISSDRLGTAAYIRMLSDMRASPTCSQSSLVVTDRLGYDTDVSSLLNVNTSSTTAWAFFTHAATGTAYYPNFVAVKNGTSGYFTLSAEL